jgi:transcriptional regulator with XRE-family HTH domain
MDARGVGFALVTARRKAGSTQAVVAERMGTTQSAVSRVEAGRAQPTLDFVERYAQAVGQPITLTFGRRATALATRKERALRVRRVLGDKIADPWDRDPSPAEQRVLEAAGLTRDYFRRKRTARSG